MGIVVYAGKDTKLMLNLQQVPSKMSKTEQQLNRVSIFVLTAKIILCIIGNNISFNYWNQLGTVCNVIFESPSTWYLMPSSNRALEGLIVFLAYFVLLGYYLPLSLFVNLGRTF